MLTGRAEAVHHVVPLARVIRSGFLESVHHGALVALDPSGTPIRSAGDVTGPVFPRSSLKPLQAVAMLRCGLDPVRAVPGELTALAAASHSGEPYHLDGVRRILALSGLEVSDLRNTPDRPLDEHERTAWLIAGRGPSSLAQNCSGKHAAMLATCRVNGWDLTGYLDPEHPLQQAVSATVGDLTGEQPAATGVDGCGAPVFAGSLTGLARAYARIATAEADTPEGIVAQAFRSFPQWVAGTNRDATRAMASVPGLVAKDGAEGVYAGALPDGRAFAFKVADGGARARPVLLAESLAALGVDSPVLQEFRDESVVLGHGAPVGRIEADLSAYAVGV